MSKLITRLASVVVALGVLGAGGWWWTHRTEKTTVSYRTEAVKQGELLATISATGTLEPEEVVDVGAQVAGMIDKLGDDLHKSGKLVDYTSEVDQGQVLAHIDDTLYQWDVKQAQAQLEQAKANVTRAEADLVQMNAKLRQTQRDWERAQKLGPSDALSQADYDMYKANFEIAAANVQVANATIRQTNAAVEQTQAALDKANRNVQYCTIKSPVKGVIIDRRVNSGQTVVASLNAPSLFLIAKDLRKMQVWVPVNEADIGSIHPGQPITFTADANPGRTFKGVVGKVRLNANMTQNVVTYTVEVLTDNSDGALLPYATANVQFEVARHTDVLLVPNAALRWSPKPEQIAPDARDAAGGANRRGQAKGPTTSTTGPSTNEARPTRGTVWVQAGDYVRPINVRVVATDGALSEVAGKDLAEGLAVITGENQPSDSTDAAKNPFMPQMPGRRGGR